MNTHDKKREFFDKNSPQRKTTLKWRSDGELSEIDMARIISKLEDSELVSCDFACDLNIKN